MRIRPFQRPLPSESYKVRRVVGGAKRHGRSQGTLGISRKIARELMEYRGRKGLNTGGVVKDDDLISAWKLGVPSNEMGLYHRNVELSLQKRNGERRKCYQISPVSTQSLSGCSSRRSSEAVTEKT